MAAFATSASRSLPSRGGSAGFRFFLYAIFAVVLMVLDQRGGWLELARAWLTAAAYPIQLAVNSPTAAARWIHASFESRANLQSENARLRERVRQLELRSLRFDALQRENAQLRALSEALPPVAEKYLIAEVVSVELNPLRQRLLINRGARSGVFKGQAALTAGGVLGQTLRVGPWSSEVILTTDPEHAIPVQVQRSGTRTIAVGGGSSGALTLPYLPVNADIVAGDVLVTSGLGGVFPEGYPVARVQEVVRDPAQALAQVRAAPLANVERDREIMLVWFRPGHPAAPWKEDTATTAAVPLGGVTQPAPPQPQPAAPAAEPTAQQPQPEALPAQPESEPELAPEPAAEESE